MYIKCQSFSEILDGLRDPFGPALLGKELKGSQCLCIRKWEVLVGSDWRNVRQRQRQIMTDREKRKIEKR